MMGLWFLLTFPALVATWVPAAPRTSESVTGGLDSRPNLAKYLTDNDYPAAAIRAGQQGTVAFVLDVSAEGAPTACRITESSQSTLLDATTCRLMKERVRLSPARDPNGTAVTQRVESKVRWIIPDDVISVPERIEFALDYDDKGEIAACRAVAGTFVQPAPIDVCLTQFSSRLSYLKDYSDRRNTKIAVERLVLRDDTDQPPEPLMDRIIGRVVYRSTHSATTGETLTCEVIEERGHAANPQGCHDLPVIQTRDAKADFAVRVAVTAYLRGEGQ